MPHEEPERHLAIAANGDDLHAQVDALEGELRQVHLHLDGVLCALESLLRSPMMDSALEASLRNALEPAAKAIHSGADRLRAQVGTAQTGTGW